MKDELVESGICVMVADKEDSVAVSTDDGVGDGETKSVAVVSTRTVFAFFVPTNLIATNVHVPTKRINKATDQYFMLARLVCLWLFR
jgi:hypothetical protein